MFITNLSQECKLAKSATFQIVQNASIITNIAVIVLKGMQSMKRMENVNLLPLRDVTTWSKVIVDNVTKGTFFHQISPNVLPTAVSSTVKAVLMDHVHSVPQVINCRQ